MDFGTTVPTPKSVTVTVTDTGIASDSAVVAIVGAPGAGRDADELEMEEFTVSISNIVAGVSFDVTATNSVATDGAEGEYLVNWIRR